MSARTFLQNFARRIRDFRRGDTGMTLPMLAMSMVAITGMTGMAIDAGRMQMVQSKLQFSLDAAGLAAGSTVSTTSLNTEVSKYLNANFNGYLGSTLTGTAATVDSTNTIITVSATATLPTTFMAAVGVNTITVTASSQISRAVTGLELVMVLDNTGSMSDPAGGSGSKIQALQSASTTLINSLFAGNPPAGKLWVGIVPFSQAVNIGTSHPNWMNTTYDNTITNMPASQGPGWGPSGPGGCVDARTNGEDVNDDPPGSGDTLFNQYYWPSDNINYGSPYNNSPNSFYNNWVKSITYQECKSTTKNGRTTQTCTTATKTCTSGRSCAPTCPSGDTCSNTGYTYNSPLNNTQQGPNLECPEQITPMTNSPSTLITAINGMTAEGDTVINQGLQWGWNMLSPRWQGQWGGTMSSNGLPLAYGTQGMNKAVILMTDGENTIDNTAHGSYWFLENDLAGSTSSSGGITQLNNKTQTMCAAMKNAGIYIYTIALGTDVTSDSLALLQNCATAPNYFFNSPSTSQLQGIFSEISDSLSNLRVSK